MYIRRKVYSDVDYDYGYDDEPRYYSVIMDEDEIRFYAEAVEAADQALATIEKEGQKQPGKIGKAGKAALEWIKAHPKTSIAAGLGAAGVVGGGIYLNKKRKASQQEGE